MAMISLSHMTKNVIIMTCLSVSSNTFTRYYSTQGRVRSKFEQQGTQNGNSGTGAFMYYVRTQGQGGGSEKNICLLNSFHNLQFNILSSFFSAPEILDEAQAFPQSDVWSLGVLLYVLLSGQLPFKGETAEETKSNILDVKFKFEWLYNEVTMEATRLLMWIFKRGPW